MADIIYRGWAIHYEDWSRTYEAFAPNYEPTWVGGEDGWEDDCDRRLSATTLRAIYAEIDAFNNDDHYRDLLDDAGDVEHERRKEED